MAQDADERRPARVSSAFVSSLVRSKEPASRRHAAFCAGAAPRRARRPRARAPAKVAAASAGADAASERCAAEDGEESDAKETHAATPVSFGAAFGARGGRLPAWLVARLNQLGFHRATNVQARVLELTLLADPTAGTPSCPRHEVPDVVVHARTGSGKTLAYLLPLMAAVQPARASLQAAVVVPTPELGMQVYKVARRLAAGWAVHGGGEEDEAEVGDGDGDGDGVGGAAAARHGAKRFVVLPLVDQADLRRQKLQLRHSAPRLVVGTAARLSELARSGRLALDRVPMLVVDEFDACLGDARTAATMRQILQRRSELEPHGSSAGGAAAPAAQRLTMLVSATVPQHRHFLRTCVRERWTRPNVTHVWIGGEERVPERLEHAYVVVSDAAQKLAALRKLLRCFAPATAIVFVDASRDVDAVAAALRGGGAAPPDAVVALHAHSTPAVRKQTMASFRGGDAQVLVATDVASRGLDVPEVTHVFNLDLPPDADTYLHRAGRAGRLERVGEVVSISARREEFVLARTANALGITMRRLGNRELHERSCAAL